MLYMIGALQFDTRPFNVDAFERKAGADLATKPVMGGREPTEFTGEGADEITLSGQLLPTKIGGLAQLEVAHEMRRRGARVPVMRGDGARLGTFAIIDMNEKHGELLASGVGFTVDYSIKLRRVQEDAGDGSQVIAGLLSLFGALT